MSPLAVMWNYRVPLVVGALACALAAFFASSRSAKTYVAVALVQVTPAQQQSGAYLSQDALSQLTDVDVQLARSYRSLRAGKAETNSQIPERELLAALTITNHQPGVLKFSAEAASPDEAVDRALAASIGFQQIVAADGNQLKREQIASVQERLNRLQRRLQSRPEGDRRISTDQAAIQTLQAQIAVILSTPVDQVRVIQPPEAPRSAASPKPLRDAIVALVLAALLLPGLAYLIFLFRGRYGSAEEAGDDLSLPLLGQIPRASEADGLPAEPLRVLRVGLASVTKSPDDEPPVILVTSPGPGAGKSFVVSGLIRLAATDGFDMTAVDGDFRNPTLHARVGVDVVPGLQDVLRGNSLMDDAVRRLPSPDGGESEARVVPAGQTGSDAPALVASHGLRSAFTALSQSTDVVVVDSPPVLPVSDPLILSRHATAVVLVINAQNTRRREAHRSLRSLQSVGAPVVGIIFNGSTEAPEAYYGAYSSSYVPHL